jgi:hypothetical protein
VRRMIWVVAAMAASVLVMSASASAAGWNCSATALSGQPVGRPVTANVGQTTCKAASGGANLPPLPLPLQASVLSARTTLDGSATRPAQQTAGATGEVAGLSVGVPADAPIPIPMTTIPNPSPGGAPIDITQALRSLLPPPPNPLVGVKLSSATASGSCVGGKPTLTGSSRVLGLTVAGQELPVDQAVTQVVNAIGGGTIDPSQLTSQPLPAPLDQIPLATLQPLLDALPPVAIPATLAQIKITPGSQTVQNGTLTQKITIKRRVSCTRNVVVKSLRPDSKGSFSITLGGPPSGQAAVYRLATKVRKNVRNRKLFPTFTLPRAVALRR